MRTGKSRCWLVLMIRPSESSQLPSGPCRRTWTGSTNLRGWPGLRTAARSGPPGAPLCQLVPVRRRARGRGRRRNRGHPVQGGHADRLHPSRPRPGHDSESRRPRRMYPVLSRPRRGAPVGPWPTCSSPKMKMNAGMTAGAHTHLARPERQDHSLGGSAWREITGSIPRIVDA
jgi:hypothetical protein